ncbi:hypothetical protein [Nocardia sp. NRRL S-836]|uniref:hypothetical protein n=1 Tax=Nocardia sp. NRRL S-836 TaxID=1519492 RepID=UPI0012F7F1C5|nr:hypothetical protein [Nocardia sp. NRRL S-836]
MGLRVAGLRLVGLRLVGLPVGRVGGRRRVWRQPVGHREVGLGEGLRRVPPRLADLLPVVVRPQDGLRLVGPRQAVVRLLGVLRPVRHRRVVRLLGALRLVGHQRVVVRPRVVALPLGGLRVVDLRQGVDRRPGGLRQVCPRQVRPRRVVRSAGLRRRAVPFRVRLRVVAAHRVVPACPEAPVNPRPAGHRLPVVLRPEALCLAGLRLVDLFPAVLRPVGRGPPARR